MPLQDQRYIGPLYRALNPVYARTPLSGRGARDHGGRFNARGTAALYTSIDKTTTLREANQVGSLQPTMVVSYHADLGPVFDTRDSRALERENIAAQTLADPAWRTKMLDRQPVPTQEFAKELIRQGFVGLLVRSFASGATEDDLNLVLWRWSGRGARLDVVDDENRLNRM
ncbi:MAG: RES family NAD+ phosphorylase [Pseudomonadota bacterium]